MQPVKHRQLASLGQRTCGLKYGWRLHLNNQPCFAIRDIREGTDWNFQIIGFPFGAEYSCVRISIKQKALPPNRGVQRSGENIMGGERTALRLR